MILCCGEALIDMLPRNLPDGGRAFMPVAGGAVFNTAVAIARLGAPAGLFSGLSTDFFGDMLRDHLADSGVDCRLVITSNRATTLAFVRLADGQAEYFFYDENSAGRMLDESDLPELAGDIHALFFGGISLIAAPCGATYESLMRREAARRVTMLDPNVRPDFVADEKAYRSRIERMMAHADIVKVSEDDLAWLCGGGDAERHATALLARGPRVVIVTRGADGAIGLTERYRLAVESPAVRVVDTVGAGDTFNAGVLVALHQGGRLSKQAIAGLSESDLHAALQLATRAAAVTVSRAGADSPRLGEIAAVPGQ